MWTYRQRTGEIIDPGGNLLERGYSGKGVGVNNPDMQHVEDTGPLPEGTWRMESAVERHPRLGLVAIPLTMVEGDWFGRHSFYVHGDNHAMNRTASSGCIIASRRVRDRMAASKDRYIKVETG